MKIISYPFIDLAETPIGLMLIKSTKTHIHELSFIEEEKATEVTVNSSSLINNCKEQLDDYFAGKRTTFDLPLQQEGTEFQQQVWNLLVNIPYGDTISYLTLAKQMGDEKTIRAAASSNGKNKLALVIPCHRVIATDGKLTGYAWGLKRKQWLLDFEARTSEKKLFLF